MKSNTTKISLFIDTELKQRVEALKDREGRTITHIVNTALRLYLEALDKQ